VEAYEGLRRQIVQLNGPIEHLESRGILLRRGLAAWAQIRISIVPAGPREPNLQPAVESLPLTSAGAELVRLIAGLILSTQQEHSLHA
jgi:hypothetical protein